MVSNELKTLISKMLAIKEENSRLFDETVRCSWTSGDEVTIPNKYYENELQR